MNVLYNLGINLLKWGAKLAALRNKKIKKMVEGQSCTFNLLENKIKADDHRKTVWIHAASLGEFEQGRPLIEMIRRNQPDYRIVLTFFSPSGYEIRKHYKDADVVCYLPFDTSANAKRFLDTVSPDIAVFVKYEFWGNYLQQLSHRSIPTYIISSIFRQGQIFFRPWGGMFRRMLDCFTRIYVQDDASRQLLASIGVSDVTVAGDTRFDRVSDILASCKPFPIVERFASSSQFTLIIGSSWQPDEDIVIPYFNTHPGMKLIIAPHEFDDERLQAMKERITRPTVLYTEATEAKVADADCLIINCFGILSSCYRYARAAYIGGGFGAGIHNLNEAAVYGIPVIFGPNHSKFKEAHDLIECGGGFSITGHDDFDRLADRLIPDTEFLATSGAAAGTYIKQHLGATKRIYNELFSTTSGRKHQISK